MKVFRLYWSSGDTEVVKAVDIGVAIMVSEFGTIIDGKPNNLRHYHEGDEVKTTWDEETREWKRTKEDVMEQDKGVGEAWPITRQSDYENCPECAKLDIEYMYYEPDPPAYPWDGIKHIHCKFCGYESKTWALTPEGIKAQEKDKQIIELGAKFVTSNMSKRKFQSELKRIKSEFS